MKYARFAHLLLFPILIGSDLIIGWSSHYFGSKGMSLLPAIIMALLVFLFVEFAIIRKIK